MHHKRLICVGWQTEKETAMARDVYEALNEQLTTEIPQLIDLRVPYLDPSFEALVKIQLRCGPAPSSPE